jgi:poly [ADP-ribose] polymerase
VEKGLGESGKLSGAVEVHEDFAWLGNQVDISGNNNNNKFYRGQVLKRGGQFYAWTRWGRVGENGQNALDGPTSLDGAVASFSKKFKDKTSYAWAGNQGTYPGGKKGKYSVIFEQYESSGQSAKLAAAGVGGGAEEPAAAVTYAAPKVVGSLASFVGLVTDSDMFSSQLAKMGVDTSKMPLGDISPRTVEDGFKALLAVEAYLKAGGGSNLATLCSAFYTYIPHAFGRAKAPVLTLADVEAKKVMLNVIGDVGAAVASAKAAKNKTKSGAAAKVKEEPAPIDVKYASLGATLVPVDKKSAAFKMITAYTVNTQGSRKCQVEEAFEVVRPGDAFGASTAKLGNRKLLWHGTNVAVVAAILKSGLRIMPHSGGRVGSGIYLASENGKSAGYTTAQGHTGVMFLCEAALGNQRFVTKDGEVRWNDKDPVSAFKANSVLAVGNTEPDAAADMTVKFDGKDVVVPQGAVKPNPLAAEKCDKGTSSSSFSQSEYLIYNEAQCTIRYVLKMKFDTPGGHWH